MKNTGKVFEQEMTTTLEAYAKMGLMRLKKTDPPTKVVPHYGRWEVIHLANPFLDWAGCWTERGGRALFVEAKSTSEPRLPVYQESGGLTKKQVKALSDWEQAGAAVGVLWRCGNGVAFLSTQKLADLFKEQRRSVRFDELPMVGQGMGFVLVDFIVNLRESYP